MQINLSYDQAVALYALVDSTDSPLESILRKAIQSEWRLGNQLTPIHAPFVVATEEGTFIAVRKTHCSSYAPESTILTVQETGEEVNLRAGEFKWRYL